ncbi:hypothetical protein PInf_004016 [Phytophthora infestans]|nr:hypothetical protein PInf_004016 [Phytophthora infestans]
MEEVNQEEDAPPTLKMKASNAAWQVLERLVPTNSTLRETERPPQLDIDENELRNSWRRDKLTTYITARVARVYFVPGVDALFEIIAAKVEAILKAEVLINAVTDPAATSNLDQAFFSSPYSGDADVRFFRYLMRCCKLYSENPAAYTAPYVTIMQSSGFGKSRILYEVAKKIADPNTNLPESELFDCRLLYVCSNDVELSTSFPVATPVLSQYFFKQPNIADRLHSAVAYACSNWERAETEWVGLFGVDPINDSPVSRENIDEALGTALAIFMTSDSTIDSPTRKKSRELLGHEDERLKVLVLAIDEAKVLLMKKDKNGTNFFRLLRRALKKVNQDLAAAKLKMMVFAVLTDTNSQVHDLVPPRSRETSSRNYKGEETMLFPPFVLTHTMDVVLNQGRLQWDHPFDYKESVLQRDPDTIWNTLVSMGRPMWHSYISNNRDNPRGVLVMAASKLLCGLSPSNKASYGGSSLQGVASLLCRLGARPQSNSAFATQVVSDFMAVLHYVNYTYDAHISGYVTEPVLTFGATHMWYELNPLPLEEYILPQFLELLMQGLIDVGSVGEVVARIILLLAMDATTMGEDGFHPYQTGSKRFEGQFCSVKQFLDKLDGSHLSNRFKLYREDDDDTNKKLKKVPDAERADFFSWRDGWASWNVSFSHFIELTTVPTKATLWFLLGRRAAGYFHAIRRLPI